MNKNIEIDPKYKKLNIINLFGAPSSGKTTAMLGLVFQLSELGLSAEIASEFVKEALYEGSFTAKHGGQLSALAEQNKRLERLVDTSNDFVVTDCPLPLIAYYTEKTEKIDGFNLVTMSKFNNYNNSINYFLTRHHDFESGRRIHNKEEADTVQSELPHFLNNLGIELTYAPKKNSPTELVQYIIDDLISRNIITLEHLCNSRNPSVREKYLAIAEGNKISELKKKIKP